MKPVAAGFWQRRVVQPIAQQLKLGITPEKIALTLALGITLGIFPIIGSTMLLCGLAGFWLRLNQPVIQLVNYLVYPLQLAFLLPFYRAGEVLFGRTDIPLFSVAELSARCKADLWQFTKDYGMVGLYGVTVWALIAPLLVALVYFSSRPLLRRLIARSGPSTAP